MITVLSCSPPPPPPTTTTTTTTNASFQGEESNIIIISLVRSREDGRIGFLKMPNRVNVLLSRAKHGMFLIGNSECLGLRPEGNIWPDIIDCLQQREQVRCGDF